MGMEYAEVELLNGLDESSAGRLPSRMLYGNFH